MTAAFRRLARLIPAFGSGVLLLALATVAFAHAFPDHADPKVGSEVTTAPTEVKIWFTDELDGGQSRIQVFDAADKQVDKLDSHLDPKDSTILIVSLPAALPPGTYKVVWSVVCSCKHATNGDYTFVVKPKG
jgi:copper resistance protein C